MITHTDYDPSVDVRISLNGDDMDTLLSGKEVEGRDGEVHISIHAKRAISAPSGERGSESPLDYLERTWSEPRFGESTSDHSARLARGVN